MRTLRTWSPVKSAVYGIYSSLRDRRVPRNVADSGEFHTRYVDVAVRRRKIWRHLLARRDADIKNHTAAPSPQDAAQATVDITGLVHDIRLIYVIHLRGVDVLRPELEPLNNLSEVKDEGQTVRVVEAVVELLIRAGQGQLRPYVALPSGIDVIICQRKARGLTTHPS